ncbi:MAG: 4-alpha-glucanotransferase [Candidatus Dormibacteria bacterium]
MSVGGNAARLARAERWGIATRYLDSGKRWRDAPESTLAAIEQALGTQHGEPPAAPGIRIVRQGRPLRFERPVEIHTEDGRRLPGLRRLPRDLPVGYHHVHDTGLAEPVQLAVSPGRCPAPRPAWGWAAQLYAVRSSASWGVGDLADLRELSRWSAELGAGLLLVNPLHAPAPTLPQEASPYYPSSRRYRSPLYLRVEEVPGAGEVAGVAELATAGRALNANRLIDRDAVWRLKLHALELIFAAAPPPAAFEAYLSAEGDDLVHYAVYCVLAERHGANWREWPVELRHPTSAAVRQARAGEGARVRFHAWLQWLLDLQLAGVAEAGVAPMQDLAIGVNPHGADGWLLQDVLAGGFGVGAPPDTFNTQGQDWGLPPFDPWRLRAAGYKPFIDIIRAALRHAGGLRIDHVMGLFRLFWVPQGASAADGTYVRYPAGDLLDLLAIEASRAGVPVVGEDLGTVEPGVRRRLGSRNVLSYRLVWFEDGAPSRYPRRAMSAVSTHDLPTVAGVWTGADLEAQRATGRHPNEAEELRVRRRLQRVARLDATAGAEEAVAGVYAALGRAPSLLLCAALDDVATVAERPNMPGTSDGRWPNWSRALPLPLHELEKLPLAETIARSLRRG